MNKPRLVNRINRFHKSENENVRLYQIFLVAFLGNYSISNRIWMICCFVRSQADRNRNERRNDDIILE